VVTAADGSAFIVMTPVPMITHDQGKIRTPVRGLSAAPGRAGDLWFTSQWVRVNDPVHEYGRRFRCIAGDPGVLGRVYVVRMAVGSSKASLPPLISP